VVCPLCGSHRPCVASRAGPPAVSPSSPTRRSSDLMLAELRALVVEERRLSSVGYAGDSLVDGRLQRLRRGIGGTAQQQVRHGRQDRKSTRLNSSHVKNSYAVFCSTQKNTTAPRADE